MSARGVRAATLRGHCPGAGRAGGDDIVERISIAVHARDPVSHAGVASQLRPRPELALLDARDDGVRVAVVVADTADAETLQLLRSLQRTHRPVVLVITHIDDVGLSAVVEAGVGALVRRED